MSEKSSLRYIMGGFVAGFVLSLAAITMEDLSHSLTLSKSLSELHHYIAPIMLGCLSGFFGFILWKRKKQQLDVLANFTNNLHALLDVNAAITSTIHLEEVLQIIIDESTHLANLDTGAIYLHEEDRLYLGATTPPLPPDFPEILRSDSLAGHPHIQQSLDLRQPVVLPDTATAILSEAESIVVKARGLQSVIYIPLIIENRPVGTLILGTVNQTRQFTKNEIDTYRTFSGQAALAIENARLFRKSRLVSEELRMQNEKLVISTEKAEESDRLKSAFLANMSHEIRTPLNSILGFSELLTDAQTDEKLREKYNKIIQESGDQLLQIISDILDLSRIETGQVEISASLFSPQQLVEGIIEEMAIYAHPKNIDLSLKNYSHDDNCLLTSDRKKVKQILTNLVGNAIKFTDQGSVEIGFREVDEGCEFYVKDSGIGISEDNLNKIFDRFHQIQTVSKRKTEGNGLGLAISRRLVEKLGGKIWVESEFGKGSTFHFTISTLNESPGTTKAN